MGKVAVLGSCSATEMSGFAMSSSEMAIFIFLFILEWESKIHEEVRTKKALPDPITGLCYVSPFLSLSAWEYLLWSPRP